MSNYDDHDRGQREQTGASRGINNFINRFNSWANKKTKGKFPKAIEPIYRGRYAADAYEDILIFLGSHFDPKPTSVAKDRK